MIIGELEHVSDFQEKPDAARSASTADSSF